MTPEKGESKVFMPLPALPGSSWVSLVHVPHNGHAFRLSSKGGNELKSLHGAHATARSPCVSHGVRGLPGQAPHNGHAYKLNLYTAVG